MKEKWAIIKSYNNYAVSTYGRVRNLNTGKLLKHQSSKRAGNYAFVNLYRDGHRVNFNVHSIVAHTFIGDRPLWAEIHHKDTNRMNPRLDNLEYLTHKENCQSQRRAN